MVGERRNRLEVAVMERVSAGPRAGGPVTTSHGKLSFGEGSVHIECLLSVASRVKISVPFILSIQFLPSPLSSVL
jgi:hypothetical protein